MGFWGFGVLLFKAVFLTKHKLLQQKGQNLDIMIKIELWLEQNLDDLFASFMNGKPNYDKLLFIHKWYNPEQNMNKNKKLINTELVNAIWRNKFKVALMNFMQSQLTVHLNKIRHRHLIEH